jgi:hypothetical protein
MGMTSIIVPFYMVKVASFRYPWQLVEFFEIIPQVGVIDDSA